MDSLDRPVLQKQGPGAMDLAQLSKLQPPKLSQSVHREECTQCFENQVRTHSGDPDPDCDYNPLVRRMVRLGSMSAWPVSTEVVLMSSATTLLPTTKNLGTSLH